MIRRESLRRYIPSRRAIRRAKREVRERGFVDSRGKAFPAWTDATYAKRRALEIYDLPLEFPRLSCREAFGVEEEAFQ